MRLGPAGFKCFEGLRTPSAPPSDLDQRGAGLATNGGPRVGSAPARQIAQSGISTTLDPTYGRAAAQALDPTWKRPGVGRLKPRSGGADIEVLEACHEWRALRRIRAGKADRSIRHIDGA
jgi:hypothetical protein